MAEGYTYNAISDHPIIPEYDDNETKYKWNGALLNLSDLPYSEYTQTIYHISGGTTGSSLINNSIVLSYEEGTTNYYIKAVMQYAAQENVVVTVSLSGVSDNIVITLSAGTLNATADTSVSKTATNPVMTVISVVPTKDSSYIFQVVVPGVTTDKFKAYYGVYLQKNLSAITEETLASMSVDMVDETGVIVKYEIPSRDIETITEEDFPNYRYALLMAIPKDVYDGENYSFKEHTFQDPSQFIKYKDVVISNASYTLLYRVSDGTEFVSRYNQVITYQFDIKYVK